MLGRARYSAGDVEPRRHGLTGHADLRAVIDKSHVAGDAGAAHRGAGVEVCEFPHELHPFRGAGAAAGSDYDLRAVERRVSGPGRDLPHLRSFHEGEGGFQHRDLARRASACVRGLIRSRHHGDNR